MSTLYAKNIHWTVIGAANYTMAQQTNCLGPPGLPSEAPSCSYLPGWRRMNVGVNNWQFTVDMTTPKITQWHVMACVCSHHAVNVIRSRRRFHCDGRSVCPAINCCVGECEMTDRSCGRSQVRQQPRRCSTGVTKRGDLGFRCYRSQHSCVKYRPQYIGWELRHLHWYAVHCHATTSFKTSSQWERERERKREL